MVKPCIFDAALGRGVVNGCLLGSSLWVAFVSVGSQGIPSFLVLVCSSKLSKIYPPRLFLADQAGYKNRSSIGGISLFFFSSKHVFLYYDNLDPSCSLSIISSMSYEVFDYGRIDRCQRKE